MTHIKERDDQYYTPEGLALALTGETLGIFGGNRSYLEPSGGTGVFIETLKQFGVTNIVSYDVAPKHPDIIEADFLKVTDQVPSGAIAIGNPPFGKGGSMALRFMNHCAKLGCIAVCFINPASMGVKLFSRNRIVPNLHPYKQIPLPPNLHFTTNGDQTYQAAINPVRCSFQIWVVKQTPRQIIESVYSCPLFEDMRVSCRKFTDEAGKLREYPVGDIDADFTIVSHGQRAGSVVDFNPAQKANVCRFIKVADEYDVDEVRDVIQNTDFSYFRDASTIRHNPSLSPTEIIYTVMGWEYKLKWEVAE